MNIILQASQYYFISSFFSSITGTCISREGSRQTVPTETGAAPCMPGFIRCCVQTAFLFSFSHCLSRWSMFSSQLVVRHVAFSVPISHWGWNFLRVGVSFAWEITFSLSVRFLWFLSFPWSSDSNVSSHRSLKKKKEKKKLTNQDGLWLASVSRKQRSLKWTWVLERESVSGGTHTVLQYLSRAALSCPGDSNGSMC